MDIERFKELIKRFSIEKEAIESFWITLELYKQEEYKEFNNTFTNYNKNDLFININTISLELGNWPNCDYNHVVVYIPIIYRKKHLGNYTIMFSLDGKYEDDTFVIF